MPSRPEHEARAERNEKVYAHLRVTAEGAFLDWEATALFYAALHRVEAFFAVVSRHPDGHAERQEWVATYLKAAHSAYRQLEVLSQEARYNAHVELTPARVAIAVGWLETVKRAVSAELE
jgi:hypothetical protein